MWAKVIQVMGIFTLCLLFLFSLQEYIFPNSSFISFAPIPDYLNLAANPTVTTLSLWFPQTHASESSGIELSAESALVYDITEEKMIYEKNPSDRHPMASLTKVMTAIVSLEHPRENGIYTATDADLVGEDSMGITAGERFNLKELLYGLMLKSGNDAAEVLAHNSTFGRAGFVDAMNKKAQSLGLTNTHFTNPTGLEGDGKQFTTAKDLLVITRYALETFPEFDTAVSTFSTELPQTDTHKYYYLENETNLLSSYPGVKGVKTGFTPEAGSCLITYLDYKGHKIIAILLHSDDRRQEMKDLLDYSLKNIGLIPPRHG